MILLIKEVEINILTPHHAFLKSGHPIQDTHVRKKLNYTPVGSLITRKTTQLTLSLIQLISEIEPCPYWHIFISLSKFQVHFNRSASRNQMRKICRAEPQRCRPVLLLIYGACKNFNFHTFLFVA